MDTFSTLSSVGLQDLQHNKYLLKNLSYGSNDLIHFGKNFHVLNHLGSQWARLRWMVVTKATSKPTTTKKQTTPTASHSDTNENPENLNIKYNSVF